MAPGQTERLSAGNAGSVEGALAMARELIDQSKDPDFSKRATANGVNLTGKDWERIQSDWQWENAKHSW